MKKKTNRTTDVQASAPGSSGRLVELVTELYRVTGGRGPYWRAARALVQAFATPPRVGSSRS